MADFVESAKNFVSAAVSRTSWEAQKQMRLRGKQSEIDKLLEQRHRLLDDLAKIAMSQYQQGTLSDAQLARICASIMELDQDVKKREVQLNDIKKEAYTGDQATSASTADYTPPPFNTSTGSSSSQQSTNGSAQQATTCPTCGNPIRPNSLYCRNCGTKLR
jgi:predicted HTH domain antitoxin